MIQTASSPGLGASILICRKIPARVCPRPAVANLRNLMRRNPDLLHELANARYKAHDKIFTPKQVGIIVGYLGEP